MASMVVVLRGKSQQTTVLDVSGLNTLESSFYVKLNNTIWQDPLDSASQWHVGYQKNTTSISMSAAGTLQLNATFASEAYPQAVQLYRIMNFSLCLNPFLKIYFET